MNRLSFEKYFYDTVVYKRASRMRRLSQPNDSCFHACLCQAVRGDKTGDDE